MRTVFEEGAIRIRPYEARDVDPLLEAARESITEVYKWLPWCHPDYAREDSADWVHSRPDQWELDQDYSFVVEEVATGRFLGGAGLNQIDRIHLRANLGYWTRTGAEGGGIATTATRLVAAFGFSELGLERLEILAAVPNLASQRVAEKAGAIREGILRRRLFLFDRMHDAVSYSLVRADLSHGVRLTGSA